jgi:hypothetical protein
VQLAANNCHQAASRQLIKSVTGAPKEFLEVKDLAAVIMRFFHTGIVSEANLTVARDQEI